MKLIILSMIALYQVQSQPIYTCKKECIEYLLKFGYIQPKKENKEISEYFDTKQGIKNLQKDAGLQETGFLDENTIKLFEKPRCGVNWGNHRQKRFAIIRRWNTLKNENNETIVKWYVDTSNFHNINTEMTKDTIIGVFATSFSKWSKTALLSIIQVYNESEADIVIRFYSSNHGDNFDFDGPGKVLAHAFFPGTGLGGDAHFDIDEKWEIYDRDEATSLLSVAIHELGHSLGIDHSSVQDAIMYAWYSPQKYDLKEDDTFAINYLYGVRPQYKFGVLDPKLRIYPTSSTTSTTTTFRPFTSTPFTTPSITTKTTYRYRLDLFKRINIQNSRVFIYPKTQAKLIF